MFGNPYGHITDKLTFTWKGRTLRFEQVRANNFIVSGGEVTIEGNQVPLESVRHLYEDVELAAATVRRGKGHFKLTANLMRGRNMLLLGDGKGPDLELPLYYKSGVRDWIESVIKAFVILLVIQTFVVQTFFIPTGSMKNTLFPGDYIMVEKLTYRFRQPSRGEIVVFEYPVNPSQDFIKRLLGRPGDELFIEGGVVRLNGKKLPEPYVVYRKRLADPDILESPMRIDGDLLVPMAFDRRPGTQNVYQVQLNGRFQQLTRLDVDSVEQTFGSRRSERRLVRVQSPEQCDARPGSYAFGGEGLTLLIHPLGSAHLRDVAGGMFVYLRFVHTDDPAVNRLERTVLEQRYFLDRRSGRPLSVGPETYITLGDNRNNSSDARVWSKLLKARGVMGRALLVYWPPGHMGMIPHERIE